ncbi:Protein fluG [Glycine soja]|nr:Protein fluG [Glycine soja]
MDISLPFTVLLIISILCNLKGLEHSSLVEGEGMDFSELRKAVEEVELVDGHSHNIVALNSTSISGFVQAFTVGAFVDADAIAFAQTSLSFKRSLRDVAELYGTEVSLQGVEEYRKASGIESISSTCLKAAKFSAILIDDGIEMDKKHDMQWHKNFTPFVGRILRTERVAEQILEQGLPNGSSWTIDSFTEAYVSKVYLDFGLAIPKLSVHGMTSAVKDLLNLAPLDKVMFSTDAYTFPETFYLGAKNSREVVFSVLHDACIDGELSIPEAVEAAKDILARNAIRFYKISSPNNAGPP